MHIINITIAILFITFIEPKICKLFSREVFHCTTAQCQVIWVGQLVFQLMNNEPLDRQPVSPKSFRQFVSPQH